MGGGGVLAGIDEDPALGRELTHTRGEKGDVARRGQGQVRRGGGEVQQRDGGEVEQGGRGEVEVEGGGGKDDSKPLKLRLDLNLDVAVELKAKVHGDVTLSLL